MDTGGLQILPIGSVIPNEFQPRSRFDEDALSALTESVRELGVLQPILVRPRSGEAGSSEATYELIAGERRWRAARRAGLTEISAIVRQIDDQRSLEEAIVENLHRSDLNAIEESAAFRQLIDEFGLTQDQVAIRVGRSRSAVANLLRLGQLPSSVQRMIMNEELSAGHARALLSLEDRVEQRVVAQRIVADGLSVRDVEELVRAESTKSTSKKKAKAAARTASKSTAALELERVLGDRFDTRVEVIERSGTGRIVINFADREDLQRIFDLLQ